MQSKFFLILASAAFALAVPTAIPAAGLDSNDVYIKSFTYAGSGCKAGSVANATDASKQVLTLLYDSYVASIGPGTTPTDWRKNCDINLDIHYPSKHRHLPHSLALLIFSRRLAVLPLQHRLPWLSIHRERRHWQADGHLLLLGPAISVDSYQRVEQTKRRRELPHYRQVCR